MGQLDEREAAAIKLASCGIDPTERRLTAFASLASVNGKDLGEVVEAVTDAAVCEYERLKSFGIQNSREGGEVTLSRRGESLTVTEDSVSITEAIAWLGER